MTRRSGGLVRRHHSVMHHVCVNIVSMTGKTVRSLRPDYNPDSEQIAPVHLSIRQRKALYGARYLSHYPIIPLQQSQCLSAGVISSISPNEPKVSLRLFKKKTKSIFQALACMKIWSLNLKADQLTSFGMCRDRPYEFLRLSKTCSLAPSLRAEIH